MQKNPATMSRNLSNIMKSSPKISIECTRLTFRKKRSYTPSP